jgi:arabinofuranosyltransferase
VNPRLILLCGGGVALLLLCGSSAWVGEDAHITFRAIDNWVAGYGLRWNVDERVQTFTHPLWLLTNAIPYAITREVYWTTTVIGLACTTLAYALVGRRLTERPWQLALGWVAPLLLSQSFVRYATSGFENSLSYLLLAVFAATLLEDAERGQVRWRRLLFVTALASVNRLDTLLLYAPTLIALARRERAAPPARDLLLASLPAVGWFGFATFYYGFPLPNTALAKLNPELSWGAHLQQGVSYALELVATDPMSFAALAFAIAWTLRGLIRRRGDSGALDALAPGCALYIAYVIGIGGDFLSGRFWALPVFASIAVFATSLDRVVEGARSLTNTQRTLAFIGGGATIIALAVAGPGFEREARERRILELPVARKSLGPGLQWEPSAVARSVETFAEAARKEAERAEKPHVTTAHAVGFSGYYSGPHITIIDRHALTDPLLARLPPIPTENLHIGHFARALPRGYLYARRTGSLARMDPALRDYYEQLRLVTSGPLTNPDRLRAIPTLWFAAPPRTVPEK